MGQSNPSATVMDSLPMLVTAPPLEETALLINAPLAVYQLAQELYKKHPAFNFLGNYRIKYLLRKKPKTRLGQLVLGSAKVVSESDQLLHSWQGVVTLDQQFWDTHPDQQEALLAHELCHFERDEESGALTVRGHDIEEFNFVIRHYGDWLGQVRAVRLAQRQAQLEFNFNQEGGEEVEF